VATPHGRHRPKLTFWSLTLKPAEIIAALREKDAKIIGDVTDKKAEHILRAAFTLIRDNVVAAEKGELAFPTLGRFKVNEITKGDGDAVTKVRKVTYFPAKPPVKEVPPNETGKARAASAA
jgi:nucleoid DNA-binding protein